jgi:hypothetical protein
MVFRLPGLGFPQLRRLVGKAAEGRALSGARAVEGGGLRVWGFGVGESSIWPLDL